MDARDRFDAPERLLAESEWLARLARGLVSSDEAEDLAQDTLVAALSHPPEQDRPLRPWLARIAHNLAHRRGTSRARRAAREERAARSETLASTSEIVERVAVQRTVVEAVLALDEPYRSTLLLRYWDDLAPREIARRTDVPVETVRTRIKRGLAMLRERLDRGNGGREAWMRVLLPVAAGRGSAATATKLVVGSAGALLVSTPLKIAVAAAALVIAAVVVQRAVHDRAEPELVRDVSTGGAALAPGEPRVTAAQADAPLAGDQRNEVASEAQTNAASTDDDRRITCSVIDAATNAPVAGAQVELRQMVELVPETLTSAESDETGITQLLDPRRPRERKRHDVALEVVTPDYAPALVRLPRWNDGEGWPVDVVAPLVRGTLVSGRVVAADGRTPVAGASLRATRDPAFGMENLFGGAPQIGVSDARGEFVLDRRVAPRKFDVTLLYAVAEQGVGWTPLGVVSDLDQLDGVEVRLHPAAELIVTVRDAAGQPVESAQVTAYPRFEPLGRPYDEFLMPLGGDPRVLAMFHASTDAHGVARLAKLPVDDDPVHAADGLRYTCEVDAQDPCWFKSTVALDTQKPTELAVACSASEHFVLRGTIRGGGRVAQGASVSLVRTGPGVSTDDQGRYEFALDVPQSRKLELIFCAPLCLRRQVALDVALGETQRTLDVALEIGARIEGRIVDEQGRPLAGFQPSIGPDLAMQTTPLEVSTGADGLFHFEGLEPSRMPLTIAPPRDDDQWDGPFETVVGPADSPLVLQFHRRELGRVTLAVELVDAATQQPVAATEARLGHTTDDALRIHMHGPEVVRTLGHLNAVGLARGRWTLTVAAANGARAERTLDVDRDAGELALRIELGSPGAIVGRVVFDDVPEARRPQRPYLITSPSQEGQWVPDAGQKPGRYTRGYAPLEASEGWRFRLEDVRSQDPIELRLGPAPYYAVAEVTVPAAGEQQVELHAKLGGELAFVREDELRTTFALLTLWCEGASAPREEMLFATPDKLEMETFTVPAGRARWRVRYRSGANAALAVVEGELDVAPDSTQRVLVRF